MGRRSVVYANVHDVLALQPLKDWLVSHKQGFMLADEMYDIVLFT